MITFFIYGYWSYHLLTLQTGSANLYAALFVRGLGLGLLYVPVTNMSLSTLEGKEIAQGAALTGMLRQLGGAFGVALISTFIARETQQHRVTLVSHLNPDDPTVQQRLSQLIAGFQQRGFDFLTARQNAYAVLESTVQRQSTLLSYMDVFLWVGYLFLVCVPLVLIFVKESQRRTQMVEAGGH
jgi:DHA2 family multidrug resistance protein